MGERGARTRRIIVAAALSCFEDRGYHGTSIDDIADAVGISKATLYQYFESKEQLYAELVDAGSAELLRLIHRFGGLGPTAEGFENLRWWLGQLAWVHDKYRGVYLQWALVDAPKAPMRELMGQFVESFTAPLAERIGALVGDELDLDIDDLAVTLLAVLFRVNDFRPMSIARGLDEEEVLDGLALFAQRVLFASTPRTVLGAVGSSPPRPGAGPDPHPRRAARAAEVIDLHVDGERTDRSSTSPTVQRLLDAGAAVFAERGFHPASVEDVLRQSGLARGTFYKYFDDKAALLTSLAEDCAVRLVEIGTRFGEALATGDTDAALRVWVRDCIGFHRHHRSALRAFTSGEPDIPAVAELAPRAAEAVLRAFEDALAALASDVDRNPRVDAIVLLAMFERVPDYAYGTSYDMSDDEIVSVVTGLIQRGLLAGRTAADLAEGAGRR